MIDFLFEIGLDFSKLEYSPEEDVDDGDISYCLEYVMKNAGYSYQKVSEDKYEWIPGEK